ncbi:MAG: DciA family protein [Granulosicoccus sp.]
MKSLDSLVGIGIGARAAMREDRHIQNVISQIMPTNALPHILFCRLQEERLRITVDSAAWASRLRFSERQLLDVLSLERLSVRSVSWHVAPAEHATARVTRREANAASSYSAALVSSAAESVGDERLRDALEILSRRMVGVVKAE